MDHIGIAVIELNSAIKQYCEDFGANLELREEVKEQGVEVAFVKHSNTTIELLAPICATSSLQKFLDRKGPGLHHICYKVADIKKELKQLESQGYQIIDKEPRKGAHNTLISFIHPKSVGGVLVELCQKISGT